MLAVVAAVNNGKLKVDVGPGGRCRVAFSVLHAVGYIAQWLERLTADQQVPSSNPGVPSGTFV